MTKSERRPYRHLLVSYSTWPKSERRPYRQLLVSYSTWLKSERWPYIHLSVSYSTWPSPNTDHTDTYLCLTQHDQIRMLTIQIWCYSLVTICILNITIIRSLPQPFSLSAVVYTIEDYNIKEYNIITLYICTFLPVLYSGPWRQIQFRPWPLALT